MADSVIQAVVGKLVDYSAEAIKNQVKYLCCYSCNIQTLNDEVLELNIKNQSLQSRVNEALANSQVILQEVEVWFKKVEDLKTRSDNILLEKKVKRSSIINCFFCQKWLPFLHYSLSRKALKITNDCIKLRNFEFSTISTRLIPADISTTISNVKFASRVSIEEGILNALKDPTVSSIGIWGIGGVGKTVMAKTIETKVRDEKIFERVIMVIISQQPDIQKMQSHIATELGLEFRGESIISQKKELYQRLKWEKGILIILDDLWEMLDVQEFGIPSHCKLILTSRNHDVLTSSGVSVQNIFHLKILNERESWKFFVDNVGINVYDGSHHDELVQIAKKVEKECKGLPLALKIVGSALKGKGISFWKNALRELERQAPNNIPSVIKNVYGSLLFSINTLEAIEQKDIFLLCCLFPEDYSISTEELLRFGIGLGIFKELENLEEARDKVETVLNILLSRSLLMEGDIKEHENFNVKMHDVIRDVGIWIATKEGIEKHMCLIKHGVNECPNVLENSLNNYNWISLLFSHHSISFPESIVCPKIELLRLDFVERRFKNYYVELPEKFFSAIDGLRVLEVLQIRLLPSSLSQLNNLHTLCIQQCRIFETVSILGELINLEMLTLRNCDFEVLPMEIGNLKNLKQMNILCCSHLRRIAYGILSRLVRLEELVILDSFGDWVAKPGGDVACLSELNGLKRLTTLKMEIRNPSVIPNEKPPWVENVKKYDIIVTKYFFYSEKGRFQKSIVIKNDVDLLENNWIYDMTKDAEYVQLEGSSCMKFLKGLFESSGDIRYLKQLRLSEFTIIQYLVQGLQDNAIFPMLESLYLEYSISLEKIFEASPPSGSLMALQSLNLVKLSGLVCLWKLSIKEPLYLGNLQNVKIHRCDNLLCLFSLSVAQSLVKLADLTVSECKTMKEIFKKEDGELVEINKLKLPKLKEIKLSSLASFYNFCNEIKGIELPELSSLNLYKLPRMNIEESDDNEVHQEYLIPTVVRINSNFCRLQHLEVKGIGNFKCMFSPTIIFSGLPNLWWLKIEDCSMLEKIIEKDDRKNRRVSIFPNLNRLTLENLPNIRSFCYNDIQFPSLSYLEVRKCPLMMKFVEEHSDRISSSKAFLDERVQCPKLKKLSLSCLNISEAFSSLFFKSLTVLENLYILYCEELECMITKEEEEEGQQQFIQKIPLKNFVLKKLPKLNGSIFSTKQSLKFLLLEEIEIEDCPMLEKFSFGTLHLPNLKIVRGFFNTEFAANFFYHKQVCGEEICPDNNCVIISIKDITFNFEDDLSERHLYNSRVHFLAPQSSEKFLDAITTPFTMKKEIIGKFKIGEKKKIEEGIEYEVMLMMMILRGYGWEVPIQIELKKLPQGIESQRTEILEKYPANAWINVSLGRFVAESQQKEDDEFEFSLHLGKLDPKSRTLCIKGIRIVQV